MFHLLCNLWFTSVRTLTSKASPYTFVGIEDLSLTNSNVRWIFTHTFSLLTVFCSSLMGKTLRCSTKEVEIIAFIKLSCQQECEGEAVGVISISYDLLKFPLNKRLQCKFRIKKYCQQNLDC